MPEGTPFLPASATRFRAIVAALLMVVVAAAAYAVHERSVAKQLAAQNSTVTSTLNATRDQMSALTAKLDAVNAERSAEKSAAPHSAVYRKPLTAASMRQRSDDPRWKKIQTGRTTTWRPGTMPNCPRRSDARIGIPRV